MVSKDKKMEENRVKEAFLLKFYRLLTWCPISLEIKNGAMPIVIFNSQIPLGSLEDFLCHEIKLLQCSPNITCQHGISSHCAWLKYLCCPRRSAMFAVDEDTQKKYGSMSLQENSISIEGFALVTIWKTY